MDKAILFGLASAMLYGLTDFVARYANKSNGVVKTLLWGQALMAVLLTLVVASIDWDFRPEVFDWTVLTVSNLMIMAGTAFLYHGLAVGRMSVVTPVMAAYGGISTVLSFIFGEPFTLMAALGLGLTATGAVLSAASPRASHAASRERPTGWRAGAAAAVLYGVAFWMQGTWSVPVFGPLMTIWIYYLTATAVFALVAMARRTDVRLSGFRDSALIFITALLAAGGYLTLSLSQGSGGIAIGPALGASASAVTVILAFGFAREKVAWMGWLGVASVVAGVALLHLTRG